MGDAAQERPGPVAAVGAVVLDAGGRVLLIRRARPPRVGSWTLPGGRLERGESAEAAVVRELREETALAVRVVCSLGEVIVTAEGASFAILEHLAVVCEEGAPRAGDDAAEARFFQRSELGPLGVLEDALAVIDRGIAEARARDREPLDASTGPA